MFYVEVISVICIIEYAQLKSFKKLWLECYFFVFCQVFCVTMYFRVTHIFRKGINCVNGFLIIILIMSINIIIININKYNINNNINYNNNINNNTKIIIIILINIISKVILIIILRI